MANLLRGVITAMFTILMVVSCDIHTRTDILVGDVVRVKSGSYGGCYAVITGAYMVPKNPMILTLRTKCSRVNDGISELIETSEDNVRRVDFE